MWGATCRGCFWSNPTVVPVLGALVSYAFNRLDRVHTFVAGAEVGVLLALGSRFSLTLALQPGLDYFPDAYSRQFVGAPSGLLPHFGVTVHVGYNFG